MKKKLLVMFLALLLGGASCHFPHRENVINDTHHSFVKMEKYLGPQLASTGSGFIVENTDAGAYIMTAGHVCQDHPYLLLQAALNQVPITQGIVTWDGLRREFYVIEIDDENDMCLGYVHNMDRPEVDIATLPPKVGEEVYSVSAPRGIADPEKGTAVVTSGLYSGELGALDMYTMRISFGSSGGMIINKDGEIVGMTVSKIVQGGRDNYDNLTFSPKFEKMISFLEKHLYLEGAGGEDCRICQ